MKYDKNFFEIKENNYMLKFNIQRIPEGFILRGKIKGNPKRVELFRDDVDKVMFINNWQSWGVSKSIDIEDYTLKISEDKKSRLKYSIHIMPELFEKNIISDYFIGKKDKIYGFLTSKIAHPFFEIKDNELIAYLDFFDRKFEDYVDIEPFIYLEGKNIESLLEIYADYVKFENKPKFSKWNPIGWSSWYQYYEKLTWEEILKNLELSKGYNYEVFQIDDSWQKDIGDWVPKDGYPSLKEIANKIREYNYIPGIWLAPFSVSETSDVYKNHKDWLVKDDAGNLKVAYINWKKKIYALDTTHPEVQNYLRKIFLYMRKNGIHYFKIDFLFAGAIPGNRYEKITPIEAYNLGMQIIRKATKGDFLLGCGAPLLPSIGYVDGMRISEDTAPYYNADDINIPYQNAYYALRNVITRYFMNGKWWWNDPDCLSLRIEDTKPNEKIIEMYAYVSGILNNIIFQSDDLSKSIRKDVFFNTLELRGGNSHVKGLMNFNNFFEIEALNTKIGNIKMKVDLEKVEYSIEKDIEYPQINKRTIVREDDKRLFHYYEESDLNA
ncbi:glycoside hydrolase family 36 protein [Marinitoga lauensis]|uniref:glycoside hydrolase family 36 protein n=1 Tax=Marinitoga lauensis TaxID=2201189 RepID=UPI001F0DD5E1|nr:alpha-galactosidase [Marinitoga lauensis]